MRRTSGNQLAWLLLGLVFLTPGACDSADEEISSTSSAVGDPADEEDVVWVGGSVTGESVWEAPPPSLPPPPKRNFLERAAATFQSGKDVLLVASVTSLGGEHWDSVPVEVGWAGPNIVTKVGLVVEKSICGAAMDIATAYYQGGETAVATQSSDNMPNLMIGKTYVLLLRQGKAAESTAYFIRSGHRDVAARTPEGAFDIGTGVPVAESLFAGVCP